MMRFAGLSQNETWFLGQVEELIRLRRTSLPLIYGDYDLRYADDKVLVYSRTYMGEEITVGINNSAETVEKEGLTIEPYSYTINKEWR